MSKVVHHVAQVITRDVTVVQFEQPARRCPATPRHRRWARRVDRLVGRARSRVRETSQRRRWRSVWKVLPRDFEAKIVGRTVVRTARL
jgi:hypothetical protein